jgi:hypothetical protein
MNEVVHLLASLITEKKSITNLSPLKELEYLLKKFYETFQPSKCVSCDKTAEFYLDQLPLLSRRLLATYGSDLCFVLKDSRTRTSISRFITFLSVVNVQNLYLCLCFAGATGWTAMELQILLIRYYAKINPCNLQLIECLAARFSGSRIAYLALNQQLMEKYGTDLEDILSLAGRPTISRY